MDAQVESFLAIAISFSVPSLATQVKNTQSSKISWPFDLAPPLTSLRPFHMKALLILSIALITHLGNYKTKS